MARIARFSLNEKGRDFVVGDIHGHFSLVRDAMKKVNFDKAVDRIFSVGDMVDRGPESNVIHKFLEQPYVHAICGNHEAMWLEAYEDGEPDESIIKFMLQRNGMGWWADLKKTERIKIIGLFKKLPIAIEIETRSGLVGLVHAEVPRSMNWSSFVSKLEDDDSDTIYSSLWNRDRVYDETSFENVAGISKIYCGHTPLDTVKCSGNIHYIDTGAFIGKRKNDPIRGRLSFIDIMAPISLLKGKYCNSFTDIASTPRQKISSVDTAKIVHDETQKLLLNETTPSIIL